VQTAESSAEPTQPAGPRKRHPARRYPAESFTRDEVQAILAACSGSVAGRNRALIIVLWRAGLRLGEALALRPRDVDAAGQSIRVLHGKGDKARVGFVPLTDCGRSTLAQAR
jgi:integrase